MTALDLLRQRGPMPAEHLAAVLQIPEEEVYVQLVRAYDAKRARIRTGSFKAQRVWEAMEAQA